MKTIDCRGFTLIELVIVIVILGVLATYAAPKIMSLIGTSKENVTETELSLLKSAIYGNTQSRVAGVLVDRGFYGHMGYIPGDLNDLVVNPDGSTFNKFTQAGWSGPYVSTELLSDPWGNSYQIDTVASELKSLGPDGVASGDDIILSLN